MIPWKVCLRYKTRTISRYLKHRVVYFTGEANSPAHTGCGQARLVTCGPLLCCVAVLSRVEHKPRCARLPKFLLNALPDTREYLCGQSLGILEPLRESQLATHLLTTDATGLPPAFCRRRVAQAAPSNSSARPPASYGAPISLVAHSRCGIRSLSLYGLHRSERHRGRRVLVGCCDQSP